jgi:predicted nucleic acid-binding protein
VILLDTNILVHAATVASPRHAAAKEICRQAWDRELEACVALQNLCEWYAIVTDSKRVSVPLSAEQASRELEAYGVSGSVKIIAPSENSLLRMPRLLRHARCKGSHVFDLLLVATMIEHGAETIYTENIRDFSGFREIRAVNPFA